MSTHTQFIHQVKKIVIGDTKHREASFGEPYCTRQITIVHENGQSTEIHVIGNISSDLGATVARPTS